VNKYKSGHDDSTGMMLILEMPMLFRAVFQMIKTWLPAKVRFVVVVVRVVVVVVVFGGGGVVGVIVVVVVHVDVDVVFGVVICCLW
jgi:hypothetical protein